ncbi:MAG: Type 1 glutamine amidotransferase-like domain-containing protein [Candidatus Micrarchaeota archaeon]|nr:Type 1 glutamine amidotransferase-like domain-containing protein [Candidatus Micrarchaeota archaeon]
MIPKGTSIGLIPNALDYVKLEIRRERNQKTMKELTDIGISVKMLDLRRYFGKEKELKKKIYDLGGIWVRGGNTFVLRQAMRLSGLDKILKNMKREDFLYAGYSAGGCVLSPDLEYLQNVDDPTITPYRTKKVIWKGLGLIDYAFLPHYKSDHPESEEIDKELEYCKKNGIPFKTLRDGEVIII